MSSKHIILVDSSAYIFRAFHALPPLTNSKGEMVNAVLGFANMILNLREKHHDDAIVMIFDSARKTFRNDIYPAYKANRTEPPEELVPQFAMVRELATALALPVIELPGFEADDLIATYSKAAVATGYTVEIYSSDKDLMQLVNDKVVMVDPVRNRRIDVAQVINKFGVPPSKVIDVQALCGDSVDNIPGVPGIGIKTAALLINQFGSLDNLLAQLEQIPQTKRRQTLVENRELALISRRLVELRGDIELPQPLSELAQRPLQQQQVQPVLEKYELKSVIRRLAGQWNGADAGNDKVVTVAEWQRGQVITSLAQLQQWVLQFKGYRLGLALLPYSPTDCYLALVGASSDNNVSVVVLKLLLVNSYTNSSNLNNTANSMTAANAKVAGSGKIAASQSDQITQFNCNEVLQTLQPLLQDPAILLIGFDIKQLARQLGVPPSALGIFQDIRMLDCLVRGEKSYIRLSDLAQSYEAPELKKLTSAKEMANISAAELQQQAAAQAQMLLLVQNELEFCPVQQKFSTLLHHIELPLVSIVARMENNGIMVDRDALQRLRQHYQNTMVTSESEIFQLAGREFNVGSPKQLGEVLFDELKITAGHKTASGGKSTDAEVLEKLAAEGYTIARHILTWRQAQKLKSTYCDALLEHIDSNSRIHTEYSLQGARTGRFSSTNPNLQNIPIKSSEGQLIREVFVATPGYRLLSLDYNQIELRLLATISDLPTMRQAFQAGQDIHLLTAQEIFGSIAANDVREFRNRAKAINFGIIYGISAFGLARQLGIAQALAKDYIEQYHVKFPGIKEYMNNTIAMCRKQGYITTMFGRRISLAEINSKNHQHRLYAERQAINAPVQGAAADIIKRSMQLVDAIITRDFPAVKILLQVHDELLLEIPEDYPPDLIEQLQSAMQEAHRPFAELAVPLLVDSGLGQNWNTAH